MAGPTTVQLQRQLQTEIEQRKKDTQRAQNRSQAQNSLNAFLLLILAKGDDLQAAAERIGAAYATAAAEHQKALQDQDQIKALETQICFSVLTVATSGLLSWVTEVAKAGREARLAMNLARLTKLQDSAMWPRFVSPATVRDLITAVEGPVRPRAAAAEVFSTILKDTTAAGLGEGFSALGPLLAPASPSEPVSIDPLNYRKDLVVRIYNLTKLAKQYLWGVNCALGQLPDEAWDDYNDAVFKLAQGWWLWLADGLAGQDRLPPDQEMAEELERALWAAWMPRLYRGKHYLPKGGGVVEEYESLYSPVMERFRQLNILSEAGVEHHWYNSAESEARPLIAWAARYKLQPWAPDPVSPSLPYRYQPYPLD